MTALSGSTVAPGNPVGILSTDSITLAPTATLEIDILGAAPGTGHDQVDVTGAVDVSGSALTVLLGYLPEEMTEYVIVNNDAFDDVIGTFAGLPEGDLVYGTLNSSTQAFAITYQGGTGNDIVLTAVPEPATMALLGLAVCGLGGYLRRRRAA